MPGAEAAVHVEGLGALNRSFARISADLKRGLHEELAKAAEPVRVGAEQYAVIDIENIGPLWQQMRVGVTSSLVYVAPKQRRRRGNRNLARPNLAPMLETAMESALDDEAPKVVTLIDVMLGRLAGENGF